MGLFLIPTSGCAQENEIEEEESAEVFLEEYTDEFQEKFFEALKQKGIENYDRAINLFLECKRLEPNNSVLDHELAKAYLASKKMVLAQEYGIAAVKGKPDDYWVLNTLVNIVQRQGSGLDVVKDKIPYNNAKLLENLAMIYFKQENYDNALKILNGMKVTVFSKDLTSRISNSIKVREDKEKLKDTIVVEVQEENPMDSYVAIITGYLSKSDFKNAEGVSVEALEIFPAQPYFYYAYGLSLNKGKKHKEAIVILESGLDYLLDDVDLANKMYKELVDANNALGNSSKANMYLSKIKTGS
ncbi:ChAPs family protein [Arenibacter sp. F20364]|uniref:tetratricopeptide repeat protein n=1 Tax=Arenibacter sp. F20364 TaxID=2926415 RepID=UPI001FF44C10|nr:ChAPs family protein [Arenibacter sp. F20364]MCK0192611.1 ChAPs family protein [Arenibacter sp. F20364]